MRNAIFIAFNDKFYPYARRCLKSLEINYPDHPEVLVCYDGKRKAVKTFLQKINRTRLFPIEDDFLDLDNINLGWANSKSTFFRYILWTSAFDEYETIIHLDVDTIVTQPLDDLLSKAEFFAVKDYTPGGYTIFKDEFHADSELLSRLAADNITMKPADIEMMNAGVFVINRKHRTDEQFKLLWRLTERYSAFTNFVDQAAISLWCHLNRISFSEDIEWNFQISFFTNPAVFFKLIVNKGFSLGRVRVAHYSWWKRETSYYQHFLAAAKFMVRLETYANKL